MKPHNLVLSFMGACLLWVGWFGFNAGSALAANGLATSAFVATHFGAAAATLSWLAAEWVFAGKPSMLGGISGCVAGLVAITPASGFVKPFPAMVIGVAAGLVCYFMVTRSQEEVRLRRCAGCIRRPWRGGHGWEPSSRASSLRMPLTTR